MANESTVDQQQLQSTIDELWRRLTDLVKVQLGAINVGDNQALGFLSTIDDLANAPVGDQVAFLQAIGLGVLAPALNGTVADIRSALELGVAATGDAATVRQALELGSAAQQPDSRYAKLSGGIDANFSTMPRVGSFAIVERGSNSNGTYVRYADGTQICSSNIKIARNRNNLLRSGWSFPAAFSAIPTCSGSASLWNSSGAADFQLNPTLSNETGGLDISAGGAPSKTGTAFQIGSVSGTKDFLDGDYMRADVLAIGAWK